MLCHLICSQLSSQFSLFSSFMNIFNYRYITFCILLSCRFVISFSPVVTGCGSYKPNFTDRLYVTRRLYHFHTCNYHSLLIVIVEVLQYLSVKIRRVSVILAVFEKFYLSAILPYTVSGNITT